MPSTQPLLSRWPLQRFLTLLLLLLFAGLAADLRLEHVDVVREDWRGWIPIAYSLLMAALSLITLIAWSNTTRSILFYLSTLAFLVGALGFWFHNHGNLGHAFLLEAQAWYAPIKHPKGPPPSAPLAFFLIGLLGITATARRFSSTKNPNPS
ncbi:MAG TPA: hypothetical protein VH253_11630 [Phycisphaerae bacterium]|nr:hypothetical protein [Phycisphaerae bacterium]